MIFFNYQIYCFVIILNQLFHPNCLNLFPLYINEDFVNPNWVIRSKIHENDKFEQIQFINFGDQAIGPGEDEDNENKKNIDDVKKTTLKIDEMGDNEKPLDLKDLKESKNSKDLLESNSQSNSLKENMNFKTEETKINSPINSDIIPNKINESINEQLYESMSSITGIDGESFHSFIPSAYLHEEDRKTIEKN